MGIEKQILTPGNGPKPVAGQKVTVHCTGYGKNGDLSQKFWSTKDPGQQPFTFQIGKGSVIKGWDEGVMGMQLGETARLRCSPDYAYGAGGFPAWGIQPNSVLDFEIEVLSYQPLMNSFREALDFCDLDDMVILGLILPGPTKGMLVLSKRGWTRVFVVMIGGNAFQILGSSI
ncbi:hypothetical protein LWI28_010999 [Acer negundo]|nr:hypothetical protein LWI28_010999 [Acer negundo]